MRQFSRTVAPDTKKAHTLIGLMKHFNWNKVVILSSTDPVWSETAQFLNNTLTSEKNEVLQPGAFESGKVNDATLTQIKRSGFRIVILMAFKGDTETVAEKAHENKMLDKGWAWILLEKRSSKILRLQGWLFIRPLLSLTSESAFAKNVSDYGKKYFNAITSPDKVDLTFSAALYDAIMLYAEVATNLLSEGKDLRGKTFGKEVTRALRSTTIQGIANTRVRLDSKGDRNEVSYEVMNYVNTGDDELDSVVVGKCTSANNQNCQYTETQKPLWPGNSTTPPADGGTASTHSFSFC